ncbi:microsomal glutathione S-transferase 1-like [Penaeus japonicus]|uniref:microsomal glutathione S-transferase 1-like n=1 Tax=Penaeus japonicus TaxID=27405 RepID=UPI001C717405|nr:microsomal glutathione S-transferase 1-like [Penaeus japonicus]
MTSLDLDNPVFVSYVFYSAILALKMILMGPITGYYRITKKVFANPEDAAKFDVKEVKMNDADVERVRSLKKKLLYFEQEGERMPSVTKFLKVKRDDHIHDLGIVVAETPGNQPTMTSLDLDNPVFVSYVFYSAILALKMILMGPITGYYRITKKVFANPEDAAKFDVKEVKMNDADVERVRRAHQNDLENIPVFWLVALLFVLTGPSETTARYVFRIYTMARIQHSVLYLRGSGFRGVAYALALALKLFMVVSVIYKFW